MRFSLRNSSRWKSVFLISKRLTSARHLLTPSSARYFLPSPPPPPSSSPSATNSCEKPWATQNGVTSARTDTLYMRRRVTRIFFGPRRHVSRPISSYRANRKGESIAPSFPSPRTSTGDSFVPRLCLLPPSWSWRVAGDFLFRENSLQMRSIAASRNHVLLRRTARESREVIFFSGGFIPIFRFSSSRILFNRRQSRHVVLH